MTLNFGGTIFSQDDVRETITNTAETSVAFNLAYARYIGYFDTGLGGTQYGLYINPTGKKLYTTVYSAGVTSAVYEYDLTTPWLISSMVFNQSLSISAKDNHIYTVFFKPDGLKMYVTGVQNSKLYEYALTTAWDISTATYTREVATPSQTPIFFRPDGRRWFAASSVGNLVYEYSCDLTPWDISSSALLQTKAFTGVVGFYFTNNGNYVFTVATGTTVSKWAMTAPYNIASAAADSTLVVPGGTGGSIFFHPNGSKFFLLEWGGDRIHEYVIKRSWR